MTIGLKELITKLSKDRRVKVFLMGDNRWIDLEDWPPQNVKSQNIFLHAGAGKNDSSLNNGILTFTQPTGTEQPDSFIYDPAEPVPSVRTFMDPGPQDYAPIESRLLTYTSDILDRDMTVIGPVKAVVYGKSTAKDTDWVVRLCDVWPDGRSMSVCEGIIRAGLWKLVQRRINETKSSL